MTLPMSPEVGVGLELERKDTNAQLFGDILSSSTNQDAPKRPVYDDDDETSSDEYDEDELEEELSNIDVMKGMDMMTSDQLQRQSYANQSGGVYDMFDADDSEEEDDSRTGSDDLNMEYQDSADDNQIAPVKIET
eukprot:UN02810